MRILIPLLLLAGVGVAYLALRGGPGAAEPGAGPAASVKSEPNAAQPLELAAGAGSAAGRAAAAGGELASEAGSQVPVSAAAAIVPESGLTPSVPEPSLEGGSTAAPVGVTAARDFEDELELKYLNASHAERLQALESLRTILGSANQNPDKDVQESYATLKREMGWLESNLDG
jgi:predicted membrane-bound mannosyltransferase